MERFESHYQYFRLKYRFFNFRESFLPDFENLNYLLHLNASKDDVVGKKILKSDSSVEIRDVNASSIDNKLNVKDNAAKKLDNRLQGNFKSKNVVNLSRRNLTGLKYLCCQKNLILFRLPIL